MICLREPSLGPVFGMKGGAAGGGYAAGCADGRHQLHFTGDFNAHRACQQSPCLQSSTITSSRQRAGHRRAPQSRATGDGHETIARCATITVSLGGPGNGYPRQDGFDIVRRLGSHGDLLPVGILED